METTDDTHTFLFCPDGLNRTMQYGNLVNYS